ncbi:hypothetical protein ACIP79_41790 [Streptomyces sp. NPDC088747]|uniref:hypothetical protein n=1 Tax=Streptomyces sp. NPDC088747 TaxID=3365886 RepID=UPI0038104A6C
MTTTPPPPLSDPCALACPGYRVGLCAGCQRETHRYGSGGCPLCQWCRNPAQERWDPEVHYLNTRT